MTGPFAGVLASELEVGQTYCYKGTTRSARGSLDPLTTECNVVFLGFSEHDTLTVVPVGTPDSQELYHMVSEGTLYPTPENAGGD